MKHLSKLDFKGYTCFKEKQHLKYLADINFVIGPNNSGKTRLLYLLSTYLCARYIRDDFSRGSEEEGMEWGFSVGDKDFENHVDKRWNFSDVYEQRSWFVENGTPATHNQSLFVPQIRWRPNIVQIFQKRHIEDGYINEASLNGEGIISILDLWKKDREDAEILLKDTFFKMKQFSDKCARTSSYKKLMKALKKEKTLPRGIVNKIIEEWSLLFSRTFKKIGLISTLDFLRFMSSFLMFYTKEQSDFFSSITNIWNDTFTQALNENSTVDDKTKRALLKKLKPLLYISDWRNIPSNFVDKKLSILLDGWHDKREEKARKLRNFLREISDIDDYNIRIYHPNQSPIPTLQVEKTIKIDNEETTECFDLGKVGAGVQEAIMLATYTLMYENAIICIEEPELHLHPRMQRKFVEFLLNETPSNQYFIATHSAHLINTIHIPTTREQIEIYSISSKNGWSEITCVSRQEIESNDKKDIDTESNDRKGNLHKNYRLFQVLESMGYRASDLLQVPLVIFVEGQSDAVYIKEWIRLIDSSLKTGLHYEFMAYGGASFTHLRGYEQDIDEREQETYKFDQVIELPVIARNFVMIFDSDLNSSDQEKTGMYTKKVLFQNMVENNKNGFVWITEGREIENFVPPEFIIDCLKTTYRNLEDENYRTPLSMVLTKENCRFVDYFNVVSRKTGEKKKISRSKTNMAKKIVGDPDRKLDINMPNLKKNIEEIIKLIRQANGITSL